VKLHVRSVLPGGEAWARLGVLHGYGDHSGRFLHAMRWLSGRGIACHGLDFRGQGLSSGRRGFVRRWEDYLDDLETFLESGPLSGDGPPRFVLAHSHGALVFAAATERARTAAVAGCVLTAPYFRPRHRVPWYKHLAAHAAHPALPWLLVSNGLRDTMMTRDPAMLRDSAEDSLILRAATPRWYVGARRAQAEVVDGAPAFRLPFLLLIGEADPVSDPEAARRFFEAAGALDKTHRQLPGLLHELLREAEREAILEEIVDWIRARALPQ